MLEEIAEELIKLHKMNSPYHIRFKARVYWNGYAGYVACHNNDARDGRMKFILLDFPEKFFINLKYGSDHVDDMEYYRSIGVSATQIDIIYERRTAAREAKRQKQQQKDTLLYTGRN